MITADEPTNHLDLGAVVWLEAYLSTYNHILIITSHSADFMDSVCTNIMDLTMKKKLVYYGGNYSTYVKTKHENEVNQMKAYHKQQEEIAHIKKYVHRLLLRVHTLMLIAGSLHLLVLTLISLNKRNQNKKSSTRWKQLALSKKLKPPDHSDLILRTYASYLLLLLHSTKSRFLTRERKKTTYTGDCRLV